jgi:hypothetical protein
MINQLTRSYARYLRHRGTLYQSQFVKKRFASPFFPVFRRKQAENSSDEQAGSFKHETVIDGSAF